MAPGVNLDNRPTLRDIAESANVSISSVSRVLNSNVSTSSKMADKIKRIAAEMGYLPRENTNRNRETVVIILPADLRNFFFIDVAYGAKAEAERIGKAVIMLSFGAAVYHQNDIFAAFQRLNIDGIIVCDTSFFPKSLVEYCLREKIHIVTVNSRIDYAKIPSVIIDYEKDAMNAVQYLYRNNHRKIAYIGGPGKYSTEQARFRGYTAALKLHGFEINEKLIVSGIPTIEGGFQATSNLMNVPEEELPSAILVFNELMALGSLHAIQNHKLSVPNDISLICFYNNEITMHSNPPLTTIAPPLHHIGELAMHKLIYHDYTSPDKNGLQTLIQSPLIIRESVNRL